MKTPNLAETLKQMVATEVQNQDYIRRSDVEEIVLSILEAAFNLQVEIVDDEIVDGEVEGSTQEASTGASADSDSAGDDLDTASADSDDLDTASADSDEMAEEPTASQKRSIAKRKWWATKKANEALLLAQLEARGTQVETADVPETINAQSETTDLVLDEAVTDADADEAYQEYLSTPLEVAEVPSAQARCKSDSTFLRRPELLRSDTNSTKVSSLQARYEATKAQQEQFAYELALAEKQAVRQASVVDLGIDADM